MKDPDSTKLDAHRIELENPDLARMRTQLDRCLGDAGTYLEQYRQDFETRFCLWEGQSRDGRRWQENAGSAQKVRPWDGASDVRTFTADEIVNERVETMMAAVRRSQIQVTALRSANYDTAAKVNILLNWRFKNHLAPMLARELEKAFQWRETYGVSALGIWWDQQRRCGRRKITLEEMVQMAVQKMEQGDPTGVTALQELADPIFDEKTIARMRELSPILDRRGALKILKELRTNGETEVPQIYIVKNQPCWEALRLFLDVFCPVETSSFESARWVERRCLLTAEDLEEKVNSEGWDRDFCEALWQHRGKSYGALNDFRQSLRTENGLGLAMQANAPGQTYSDEYAEVWHRYYHGIEKQSGVPVLCRLVWSPLVPDDYGFHDVFGYDHGQLPFVELVRERIENAMADSRSVPEIAATFQGTIKTQRDAANDYTHMTTLPPLIVPPWRANTEIKLGPAAQIPERKQGELRWLPPPPAGTNIAQNVEDRTRLALAWYFGRPDPGVSPARTAIAQEHLVGGALTQVASAARMSLQLEQQFLDAATVSRVAGDPSSVVQLSREDIAGQFTVSLIFDPGNLDPERTKLKLAAFKDYVLAFDTQNVVDRAKLAQVAARWIDPDLADQIVGDPQLASQRELESEKANLAQIVSGIEPEMVPEGQNYALRLQALFGMLQSNPLLQQQIESRPDTMAILEARIKHLSTLAEQFGANPQIGRTGATPGMQKFKEAQAKGGAPQGAYST